jgi:hypothetical protein
MENVLANRRSCVGTPSHRSFKLSARPRLRAASPLSPGPSETESPLDGPRGVPRSTRGREHHDNNARHQWTMDEFLIDLPSVGTRR